MSSRFRIHFGLIGTLGVALIAACGCDRANGTAATSRPTASTGSDPVTPPAPADLAKQLFDAIRTQQPDEVQRLLGLHPELLEKERYGSRPLWRACQLGSLAVAKVIVERGADLKALNPENQTVLWAAVSSENLDLVRYLIARGADPKALQEDRETLLWAASTKEMAGLLLDAGVDPKHTSALGDHAINVACKCNRKDVVELLLATGIDIEQPGRFNMRPLHSAASSARGEPEPLVLMLLKRGANIDSRGYEGRTALHDCADYDRIPMAKILLARGAKVDPTDDRGRTPADLAKMSRDERTGMLNLLYGYGDKQANPNLQKKPAATPSPPDRP